MAASNKDDWWLAAEAGDAKKLQGLINKGGRSAIEESSLNLVVAAAVRNHTGALAVLLDWGTPLASMDREGRRLLHAAAEAGADGSVAMLCHRNADIEQCNKQGHSPLVLALKANQLKAAKELLRAGARIPKNIEAQPGLAAIVRDIQTEKLGEELKAVADSACTAAELAEADSLVLEAHRAHMKLLHTREEAKAGQMLITFEKMLHSETAAATAAELAAEQLTSELKDTNLRLLKSQNELSDLVKELAAAQDNETVFRNEDKEARQTLAQKRAELQDVAEARAASEKVVKGREEEFDTELAECAALDASVASARADNEALHRELRTANAELRELKEERSAAAELTAKAHRLLGH
mmetsp:Transcript_5824/g.16572  ORF Transcript_5824/g.16572 Transcript_5824/m.16572 type:complete len:355 (-) Transcript_5824:178-1242(-)